MSGARALLRRYRGLLEALLDADTEEHGAGLAVPLTPELAEELADIHQQLQRVDEALRLPTEGEGG